VPELIGTLIRLRELNEDDIPGWFSRATDAESADLAGDPIPASIDEGTRWLQRHRDRFRERAAIRWAIVIESSTHSVGTIGLSLAEEERVAELGVVVARAHWGKAVATCAARLVTRFGFDVLGLEEIRGEVLLRNRASRRLLDKLGFQQSCAAEVGEGSSDDADACCIYVLRHDQGRL
jgi:[ribosomal protein S5]-alanine N-acetyltransferase